jgi:hypothetical protein
MSAPASIFEPVKRVATPKMIEANRQNALKSTGPTTEQGKQRSSQNAITHGIFAQNPGISDDEAQQFDDFRLAMLAELNPANMQEMRRAEIVINCHWRMRRADNAEVQLLEEAMRKLARAEPQVGLALAFAINRESSFGLNRLDTYQQRLGNQTQRAMRELRQPRKEQIVPLADRKVDQLSPFLRRQLQADGYNLNELEGKQGTSETQSAATEPEVEKNEPVEDDNLRAGNRLGVDGSLRAVGEFARRGLRSEQRRASSPATRGRIREAGLSPRRPRRQDPAAWRSDW